MNTRYNGSQRDTRYSYAYQMEYNNKASGKLLSATKRRISWRFGFPNADAVKKGLKGADCRGSEHEVQFIWSLTSGKREINADGKRVHFSIGNISSIKCEESWKMGTGHELKIIAHAAPPIAPMLSDTTTESRQYDLLIDGISFFDLPHIANFGMDMANSYNRPYDRMEKEPLAMTSRRVSLDSAMDQRRKYESSAAVSQQPIQRRASYSTPVSQQASQTGTPTEWPTWSAPVSQQTSQMHTPAEWPTPVSQQTNQTHTPTEWPTPVSQQTNQTHTPTEWPTPVSQQTNQVHIPTQWPAPVSQQTSQNHTPTEAVDLFAPPSFAVAKNPPVIQPQVPQPDFALQSQGDMIPTNINIPAQPSASAYLQRDSATFNVSQDSGILYNTPKSNIVSGHYSAYGQNPRQNPYGLPSQVMHNSGMNRAY